MSVIPLHICHVALLGVGDVTQLFPQCSNRVLILSLLEDDPLHELVELKWLVGSTYCSPVLVLFHLVSEDRHALPINKGIHIAMVLFQGSYPYAVSLTFIGKLSLLKSVRL